MSKSFVLTLTFEEFEATLRLATKFVAIGFELGLTVAFVDTVAVVTRFFVLFPAEVTFVGFFAFWVAVEAFRVVDARVDSMGETVDCTSRLCWRLSCFCSCSFLKSCARTSRTIRDTSSSSQMFGNDDESSLSFSSAAIWDVTTINWSTNASFTRFFIFRMSVFVFFHNLTISGSQIGAHITNCFFHSNDDRESSLWLHQHWSLALFLNELQF